MKNEPHTRLRGIPGGADDLPLDVNHYSATDTIRRVWPLVRPYRWRCLLAATMVTLTGLAVAVMPLFPKYVIDVAIPAGSLKLTLVAAAAFLASQLLRMALWYIAARNTYRLQQAVIFQLRCIGFGRLQRLCLRFHNRYPSGFLYERVFGSSINVIGAFMQVVFQHVVVYVAGLLFSLGFCLYLSPGLTLLIVAGAGGYVVTARKLSGRIYNKTKVSTEAHMQVVDLIMDKLRGHKTIQALALEDRMQDEFETRLWPVMTKWMDAVLESMKLHFVTEGLGYMITALVIVGGAWVVIGGHHPLGTLVAFMGYQGTLIGMIKTLTDQYGQFMAARAAFDQLFTVLDTPSSLPEQPNAVMPARFEGRLELCDMSFTYTDQPVIRHLTVQIPYGQTVALVGRSGSGKTTLTNLLLRLYDPSIGVLRLDGVDVRELPLRPYRSLWGVVLQDPYLFDTTIATNLRYARPDATDEELHEALVRARAWDFVKEFPDGMNHRVGEAGGQLSGGQRQRLAIARCLTLHSRFVILDEATSALDAEAESMVHESFAELFAGRTVLIIAHRLSTVRRADRILVLENGELAEDGAYADLLARQGIFRRLHDIATSADTHGSKVKLAGFA